MNLFGGGLIGLIIGGALILFLLSFLFGNNA